MRGIPFSDLTITGGWWKDLYDLCRNQTLEHVWNQFYETGRVEAFKCNWTEASPANFRPHIFWDSDVAKWIEGAAYFMINDGIDETLIARIESIIDDIEANITDDGYFNSYYLTIEPQNRFTNRNWHELYCTGHLLEAAIAYQKATGKDRFLRLMQRNLDCIRKAFVTEKTAQFVTPGHEEIEIALLRLYAETQDRSALELAGFFLDHRGNNNLDRMQASLNGPSLPNVQSHIPVREQREAVGHSVRAGYLYTAMADYAAKTGDEAMKEACLAIYDNIINRRMYITGGVGSERRGEQFTTDYDLPSTRAYTETCAGIALCFFADALRVLDPGNASYGDTIERILYNGFRSGLSLDGLSFFYENPLEIPPRGRGLFPKEMPITQRVKIFSCSCCPPNITRFIPSVGRYVYAADETTIYIDQYMDSEASFDFAGQRVTLTQKTDYPYDGSVTVTYHGPAARIAVRVPGWCRNHGYEPEKGYAFFDAADGTVLSLNFPMEPVWMGANAAVADCAGKAALQVGPMVYCMEEVDNGANLNAIAVDLSSDFTTGFDDTLRVPTVTVRGVRQSETAGALYAPIGAATPVLVRFIPYFAFANRGESEMMVWVKYK